MNLTPAERAAMVRDLDKIRSDYVDRGLKELLSCGHTEKAMHFGAMAQNYSALAAALKEGLTFQATA